MMLCVVCKRGPSVLRLPIVKYHVAMPVGRRGALESLVDS
jgi:hypothetical protein